MAHQNLFPPTYPTRPGKFIQWLDRRMGRNQGKTRTSQKRGPTAPSTGARNANSTASKATPETNEASKAHNPVKGQYGHNGKTPPAMRANMAQDRYGRHDATPTRSGPDRPPARAGPNAGPRPQAYTRETDRGHNPLAQATNKGRRRIRTGLSNLKEAFIGDTASSRRARLKYEALLDREGKGTPTAAAIG